LATWSLLFTDIRLGIFCHGIGKFTWWIQQIHIQVFNNESNWSYAQVIFPAAKLANLYPDKAKQPQKYICKYIKIYKKVFAHSFTFSRRVKGQKIHFKYLKITKSKIAKSFKFFGRIRQ
jgi:hypothetical protein